MKSCENKDLSSSTVCWTFRSSLARLKHIVFGDKVDIFEFDTVFTLFEFIEGIAWELSFHVAPTECALRR